MLGGDGGRTSRGHTYPHFSSVLAFVTELSLLGRSCVDGDS